MRYEFILRNETKYPVEKMCKSMKVSKNAYYHWVKTKDSVLLETPKMKLKERIKLIFKESRQIYDSCRIQKKLEREGLFYSRSYIALLMKKMELRSVLRRKYVVTTDSKHAFIFSPQIDKPFLTNHLLLGYSKGSNKTTLQI